MIAILWALFDFPEISSDTASACDKSKLPFIKDLKVNSPLSATLAPKSIDIKIIFFTIISDPWHDISTIFSLV